MESYSNRTPYQGNYRCYGQYQCIQCGRLWLSGNSWANTAQMCNNCNVRVFPHKQKPLEQPEGYNKSERKKEHPEYMCDKCKKLGQYCGSYIKCK